MRAVPRMWFLLAAALVSSVTTQAQSHLQTSTQPVVVVAEIDGIIHPISAEFLIGAINTADSSNADLLVLVLRTPGGLLESTQTMVGSIPGDCSRSATSPPAEYEARYYQQAAIA